ncbi:MAG: Ig-like domain-containing protein [Bacteroides sp.]|nr:Ig-like domain-containing protein [Bacteroides sp.]
MKKLLLSLLCVFALAAATAHAETKTYELCTDEAEILNPDNQFIVIANEPIDGNIVAAKNSTAGNSVILMAGTSVPSTIKVDATEKELALVSFKENGEYKAFYENTKSFYWGIKDNNSPMYSNTLQSSDNYKILVALNQDGSLKISSKTISTRWFQFQATYFRTYKSNATYKQPLFYKEVIEQKEPEFSNVEEEYDVEIGKSIDFPAIEPDDLVYTLSTDETDIITIDNDNKTITGNKLGTALVTFKNTATDRFSSSEGYFMVNVTKVKPTMEFRDQVVVGKTGVGVVWEPVTVIDPEDVNLRGKITYTSSDPSIVSVDNESGQTTVHAAGIVTITATMEETEDFAEGKASYTIHIIDQDAPIEPTTTVFDFNTRNPYGMTTTNNSGTYETKIKEILGSNGVVTIYFEGQYRSWDINASEDIELRMQKSSSFTISVPEGFKISKIGLVATAEKSSNINGTYTPAGKTGLSGNNGEEEWDVNQSNWMPEGNTPVTSVTFKTSSSNTTNISKIYVLFEEASSTLKSADLSFTKVINSAYVNEEIEFNAVNNPNNLEVKYLIENLDESEYTITPNGNKIKVLIKKPGYYSLQATSQAVDGFRTGLAIMRVNVYQHLDMTVDGEEHLYATPINTATDKEDLEVIINVPELMTLYYQLRDQADNAVAGMADINDEDCEAGFTPYEDGIYIPAGTRGTLVFYIAAYGYKSPKRYVPLGSASVEGFEHMVHAYGKTARMYYTIYINDHDDDEEYTVTLKVDNKPFTSTDHEISVVEAPQGAMLRKSPTSPTTHKATGYIDATGINETNAKKTHTYEITVAHNGATLSDHTATGTFITDGTTGIEDVAVDGADAAPEYFNLQGVRVAQPTAGRIYIVRRGNKVTKELIK